MAVPAALRKGSKRGAAEGEKGGALVHFFLRASEFVRNFESRKPRLEIRNLTPDSKLTYRRQSGGGAGFVGNVGRPQGREGWGENGVDDRAVVSILPANLNPPLFHLAQKSSRTLLIHSRRACEIEGERTFCSGARVVYFFRRRRW